MRKQSLFSKLVSENQFFSIFAYQSQNHFFRLYIQNNFFHLLNKKIIFLVVSGAKSRSQHWQK